MERPTPSDMMPKRDNDRDLELDKKIEALRRKNEALMKRHKEVEEDRKRAEEEGMALQSRKGKAEDFTITICKSTSDSRVVVTKPISCGSPAGKGQQDSGPDIGGEGPLQGAGQGHRKQLMVTMTGKKGKRVVSERPEKRPGPADIKSPTDDRQARRVESVGRGKHPLHMTKRDTAPQDDVKQGQKHAEEHHRLSEQCQEPESLQGSTDLNIPTSKEEQEEYVRWKKEREQIDRERVARHKNAKGQWRRAWDMDKTENMFSDKSLPERDWGPSSRGGRNARRGQSKAGHEKRGKDKGAKNVLVMSSKAKGIDRLTGRARRWQANEDRENLQSSDTTLEEFLEELDALTDTEVEDQKEEDSKMKLLSSTSEEVSGSTATPREVAPTQEKAEASPARGSEKKVRFSEDLNLEAHARQTTCSQDSASSESISASSFKASSHNKQQHKVQEPQQPLETAKQKDISPQDQGGGPSAPSVAQQQASVTNCTKKDSVLSTAPSSPSVEKACTSLQENSVKPAELAKCNISNTNTEELIDSGLSVLSLESGETHPTHSTSNDKVSVQDRKRDGRINRYANGLMEGCANG
ncbi:coiled-coil domain-containing protein 9B isoform X2 [Etheostoma spectabile]|uniref:coiled-coil domain-containing protein 9B isoform X2 n=1 Tax=Etheostoma spectabile TaxID=54343 RepID=UPI0013AFC20E|nr:coiled-coil domain-containing protein 9B isoform X2 [Etheostoma spectabile]XP_032363105.1 coiled-coil domain-containing protein 9B-like isoform X2 [Etheostoma spectabile]